MTPTHFAAVIRARGKAPAVALHGPICDRLLIPLAAANSRASAYLRGEMRGHRSRSVSSELSRIRRHLLDGGSFGGGPFAAEPLTEAEHAARFPDEAETPMRGGYPVAMFPTPATPATGA